MDEPGILRRRGLQNGSVAVRSQLLADFFTGVRKRKKITYPKWSVGYGQMLVPYVAGTQDSSCILFLDNV
ncbi:hypothetical protein AAES_141869 [Amazona aestiva]|uniref:Uncharacterized protein n=1 Tax=Amazona aestiva TaxID=12930 RepID=A0A0Q3P5M7_AMAAE|nr:hypothetical protein AAES_141869 [Amazona aestiva]